MVILERRLKPASAVFAELEKLMLEKGEAAANTSGRQELLENIVNRYLDKR